MGALKQTLCDWQGAADLSGTERGYADAASVVGTECEAHTCLQLALTDRAAWWERYGPDAIPNGSHSVYTDAECGTLPMIARDAFECGYIDGYATRVLTDAHRLVTPDSDSLTYPSEIHTD